MNSKAPYEMTDEIAFALGKFDLPSFYSSAVWAPNLEDFELVHFFSWGSPQRFKKSEEDEWSYQFFGLLKKDKFKTLRQKLKYIQGRLSSYSVFIEPEVIQVSWANGQYLQDIFQEFLQEVLAVEFGGKEKWEIETKNAKHFTPMVNELQIKSTSTVIEFIKNGSIKL